MAFWFFKPWMSSESEFLSYKNYKVIYDESIAMSFVSVLSLSLSCIAASLVSLY